MDFEMVSARLDVQGTTDEPLRHLSGSIDPVYLLKNVAFSADSSLDSDENGSGFRNRSAAEQSDFEAIVGIAAFETSQP